MRTHFDHWLRHFRFEIVAALRKGHLYFSMSRSHSGLIPDLSKLTNSKSVLRILLQHRMYFFLYNLFFVYQNKLNIYVNKYFFVSVPTITEIGGSIYFAYLLSSLIATSTPSLVYQPQRIILNMVLHFLSKSIMAPT